MGPVIPLDVSSLNPHQTLKSLSLRRSRYGVARLREFCLNAMANNFEAFASSAAFQAMVKELPPLTEFVDATIRPNKPEVAVPRGTEERNEESTNVLEDLREKWLEFEGGELEERDKNAAEFDRRMTDLRNMEPREPSDS